jgi:glycosyltransferase involved in cell wall biosynthesis
MEHRSGRVERSFQLKIKHASVDFKQLPGLKVARKRALNVCVVTSEILGPVKNGGIGTATSALIDSLAAGGHRVTILYTSVQQGLPECAERNWAHWVAQLAERGITLAHIPHSGDYREWLQKSWLVKQHLASNDYDVVYFNEHHGSGYYTLAAKRAGLEPFVDRVHCVITHGSIEWVFNTNDQRLNRATDLEMIGVERRSVEWADVVIGPSRYLLKEYKSYGWSLPRNTYRQPYPFPIGGKRQTRGRAPVGEIVFFGRLETRKGLWLFCEALDRMGDNLRGRKVTFMGRPSDVSGIRSPLFIMSRAEKWPCEVNLLLDYSQEQALEYLSKPQRVAVMPSLADNSPCVVYECMQQHIPFIATTGSGADELVHAECWPSVMCEPNAVALSERINDVLTNGAANAWPQFEAAENLVTWTAWNQMLADPDERTKFLATCRAEPKKAGTAGSGESIFLFIDDRAIPLGSMLDRLRRQMELFGRFGSFALLTTRGEPLRGMMEGALHATATLLGCKFNLISPATIVRLLQVARKSNINLFVTDICDELVPEYVAQARDMIRQNEAVAVTCAAANREVETDAPYIKQLPAGDLPAAGGIGMPITSSAWTIAPAKVGSLLDAPDFIDPTMGTLTPATDLGQLIFHRLLHAGQPIRLIPEVGTIRTSSNTTSHNGRHWYRSAVLHAEAIGLKPYLYEDGVPWLAASSFSFRGALQPEPITSKRFLPVDHPLRETSHTGMSARDLSRFAAAIGRADQAIQISTASDIDNQVSELLDTAARAVRNRPDIDLRGLLVGDIAMDTAPESVKALRASTQNLVVKRHVTGLDIFLQDTSLAVGTMTFFDVVLQGQDQFSLMFNASDNGNCSVRANIIDQSTGALLGNASASGTPGVSRTLNIPLNGIHGMFCLIVEISATSNRSPRMNLSAMLIN